VSPRTGTLKDISEWVRHEVRRITLDNEVRIFETLDGVLYIIKQKKLKTLTLVSEQSTLLKPGHPTMHAKLPAVPNREKMSSALAPWQW